MTADDRRAAGVLVPAAHIVRYGIAAAALVAAANVTLAVAMFVIAATGAAGGTAVDDAAPVILGVCLLPIGVLGAVGVRMMLRGQARGADVAVKGTSPLFVLPIVAVQGVFAGGFHVTHLILAAVMAAALVGVVKLIKSAARHLTPRHL